MKCKHCELEIEEKNIAGLGNAFIAYNGSIFCRTAEDHKSILGHEPAEPVAAAPYKPYVTELVKDRGPRIDTSRFPHGLSNLPPEKMKAHSGFIRPASSAESMDADKAAAETNYCVCSEPTIYCQPYCDNCGKEIEPTKLQKLLTPAVETQKRRLMRASPLDDIHEECPDCRGLCSPPEMPPASELLCKNCNMPIELVKREVYMHKNNSHLCAPWTNSEKVAEAASVQQEAPSFAELVKAIKAYRTNRGWSEGANLDAILNEIDQAQPAAPRTQGREPDKSQLQIDISNLRFYSAMAHDFKWETDVIHYTVISHTLEEIAVRLVTYSTKENL